MVVFHHLSLTYRLSTYCTSLSPRFGNLECRTLLRGERRIILTRKLLSRLCVKSASCVRRFNRKERYIIEEVIVILLLKRKISHMTLIQSIRREVVEWLLRKTANKYRSKCKYVRKRTAVVTNGNDKLVTYYHVKTIIAVAMKESPPFGFAQNWMILWKNMYVRNTEQQKRQRLKS